MTPHLSIPVLETQRLRLRTPMAADFDAYAAFRASDRAATLGGPYPRHIAFSQLCATIGHWQMRGYGRWMVADKETDTALGIVGLYHPEDWPEPELAWSVFGPAEGKGIAHEAALAARAYAHDTLGWSTLMSVIAADNTRSIALARKLGAAYEKDFDHAELGALQIWRHPAKAEAV